MKTPAGSLLFIFLMTSAALTFGQTGQLGIFSGQGDIGNPPKTGSASFDPANGEYLVTGGGENMWFTNDSFHFVWTKMSGDFTLSADVRFTSTNGKPHRKACLIVRQSPDPDSAYADVALHGVALTALQYRETAGGQTHEIQSNVSTPGTLRLEKRGDYVSISIAMAGEALHPAGGSYRIHFTEPFYVGLGVCSHDINALTQAVFSNVKLTPVTTPVDTNPAVACTLEYIAIASTDRRAVYRTTNHIEAPNWSRDGKYFLFNEDGRIYKLPVTNGTPQLLDTGIGVRCNNDHGISPDGKWLAISDLTVPGGPRIYILPVDGGAATQVTPTGPSYWHGWSPDGATLAFCGQRANKFDIYSIPAAGGGEQRLTTAPGKSDGPDYSPDGKYIYFNSDRTGLMQIWRMRPDGSDQEQITADDYSNWFPHPSPDGKWIAFLTYSKDVTGHPGNKDVMLRLMPAGGGEIRVLTKMFGGQGTINVPSWSPDSTRLAFVSYQPIYPQ